MKVLEALIMFYALMNIPVATIVITTLCINESEYNKLNLLFWPLLINSLREKLNKTGTIIATVFISIVFAPAIIAYFVVGSFVGLIYLACKGFYKLFKRKD
jgi:hypothetical protein